MRRLSQQQVLTMVINNWHRRSPAEHFNPSIVGTVWFLWVLVVMAFLLGLAAGIALLMSGREEDCEDLATPRARIECAKGSEAKVAGELGNVRHAATVPATARSKYVREVAL